MPLTAEDLVHVNSGTGTGTSIAASLAGADTTVAGNSVIVVISSEDLGMTAPAGFISDYVALRSTTGNGAVQFFRKPNVAAAEASWTFTNSVSNGFAWWVAEVSNLDDDPLEVTVKGTRDTALANNDTVSTGTTPANGGLDTLVLSVWAQFGVASNLGTWSGYTNELEELAEVNSSVFGLAVAHKFVSGTTGPFESTATWAVGSGGSPEGWAATVVYRAAGSPVVTPLVWQLGFEHGTHFGLSSTLPSVSQQLAASSGTPGTDLIVQASSARTSAYGCRITQAGAAKYIASTGSAVPAGKGTLVAGWNVRPVSSTGVTVLAEMITSGTVAQVVYDPTAEKVGARWGSGGTVAWQSGTTPLNTWRWVDVRVSGVNTATWHLDWRLESGTDTYTAQSSPADLTGQTAGSATNVRLGLNAAQTLTQDVDDICLSTVGGAYPLGPHTLYAKKVDPAGTPSLSGTATNFSVFTANGTLGAWDATNARNALDDLPPVVSASSDGICQTATAASDYAEFPMETYTATATEVISAVRAITVLWGGTGAGSGTLGVRGWDGAAETALLSTATSYDAGSSTTQAIDVPPTAGVMWNPVGGWTQAKLDAAAVRVGFSSDATPDMGVHALYLEVAVRPAAVEVLFGEPGSVFVEAYRNPNSYGLAGFKVTCPADRGATVNYEVNGVPATPVVVAASGTATQLLQAPAFDTINLIRLEPG